MPPIRAIGQAIDSVHAVALGKGLGAHRLSPSIVVLDEIAQLRTRLSRTDRFDESGRRVLPRPIDVALQVRARDRASRKHRERVLSRSPWLRRQPGAARALRTAQQNVFRVSAELGQECTRALTRRLANAVASDAP